MFGIKLLTELLGPEEGDENGVAEHTPHEDADDLAVIKAFGRIRGWRQREALTDGRLDGGTGRRHKVAKLVGGTDSEGSDRTRRQLHQMNRDDTPGTLHTELLEESSCHDLVGGDISVWVQQGSSNNADYDNREATTEYLTGPATKGAASHRAKVGNDLGDSNGVGGEVKLVLKEGRVEVLRAVRLERKQKVSRPRIDAWLHGVRVKGGYLP